MTTELRCQSDGEGDLYGIISDDGQTMEVRCKRRRHGARPGIIVLHQISLKTGKVISTTKYQDPKRRKDT